MLGMQGKIARIRSSSGAYYLGVSDIPSNVVNKYLTALYNKIGKAEFERVVRNQQLRDRNGHHITVLNASECKSVGLKLLNEQLIGKVARIDFGGIGRGFESSGNSTYFAIVKSRDLENFREIYDLPVREFHMTLGFSSSDIHDVQKNSSTQFVSEQTVFLTPKVGPNSSRRRHAA